MSQKHTMPQLFNKISLQNYLQPMNEEILKLRKIMENIEFLHGVPVSLPVDKQKELEQYFLSALKKKEEEVAEDMINYIDRSDAPHEVRKEFIDKFEAKYLKRE